MNPAAFTDLEVVTSRELRQLPAPRAPHTLLPRVLAAVNRWTLRPWYERAWFTWPLGWQIASAVALALVVVESGMLLSGARAAAVATVSTFAAPAMGEVAGVTGRAVMAANAAAVLWRAIGQPVVPYVFALVMLMCLACAAFGAALTYIAFGRQITFERIVPR